MKHKRYLPSTTVDVTVNDEDYVLDVQIVNIGNDGIGPYECYGTRGFDHGHDYVDDWHISAVKDPFGEPLSKADSERIINAIGNDAELIEQIQEQLDEGLDDMQDIDYDAGDDA